MSSLRSSRRKNSKCNAYHYFRMTKWPTGPKPPVHNKSPSTHAEQMTAANKKHYEPLAWDGFFD